MRLSVSSAERVIRIVLGLVIGAAGLYFQRWFGLITIVPLVTALVGWSPLYTIFGSSTCRLQPDGSST